MAFETWLAFLAASGVMLLIPGPTILLVIGQSLGGGRRAALPLVAGVALGDLTAMTLSLAGLGALLAASATLFTALKWAGAGYLVWLGVKLFRAPVEAAALPPVTARRAMRDAYVVTALNPKSIVFFVAFLPQFLDLTAPVGPQMMIFEATFLPLAALNALGYALLAAAARRTIRKPAVQRAVNRTGGSILIGAGLVTMLWRRAAA